MIKLIDTIFACDPRIKKFVAHHMLLHGSSFSPLRPCDTVLTVVFRFKQQEKDDKEKAKKAREEARKAEEARKKDLQKQAELEKVQVFNACGERLLVSDPRFRKSKRKRSVRRKKSKLSMLHENQFTLAVKDSSSSSTMRRSIHSSGKR